MNIRVAAFGTKETVKGLENYSKLFSHISIVPFTYQQPKECVDLVEEAYTCDVFLFAGPVPYLYAKNALEQMNVPYTHVPFDELMVSHTFFLLATEYQMAIRRLSIDIMNPAHVTEVLNDLGMEQKDIFIHDIHEIPGLDIAEIVKRHQQLWDQEAIDFVLTSIDAVAQALKELNIPCLKMPIPKKNFLHGLQEAKTLGQIKLSETSRIVMGLVKIKNLDRVSDSLGDFQFEQLLLAFHQILLNYTHKMDFSLYKGHYHQFIIFGTKGSFDKLISDNHLSCFVKEIEKKLNITVAVGFGSGLTARQAEHNAQSALQRALEEDESICYLYNESGAYIYLLNEEEDVNKESLMNALLTCGLTLETASRFADFLLLRQFRPFTSQEYAEYANVTTRTAARLIKKMTDTGVLESVGERKIHDMGRPRAIYQIKENFN